MKIVQINSVSNGSTGKIMNDIHNELLKNEIESIIIWGRGRKSNNDKEIYLNDKIGTYFHVLMNRLTGKNGLYSKKSTKKLIKRLDTIKPDIIHLHNIHGYYINIELLFNYIKKKQIKTIWTLHDCWAFTGQCPYFTLESCSKWRHECFKCPMLRQYPKSLVDNSKWNYNFKKKLFSGLNMTIVTPSYWLANLVKDSFLKDYPVYVINNGIDLNTFKETAGDFRKKYGIEDKKIILGVAGVWDRRKGLDDFLELSKVIDSDYIIVLIGVSKKQLKILPDNIIGITRTENQKELAVIYSSASVLFNPTYEDNYPTVNLEAISCGCPVITYNTGGSPESATKYGTVTNKHEFINDYNKMVNRKYHKKDYDFSKERMCSEYLDLYERIK